MTTAVNRLTGRTQETATDILDTERERAYRERIAFLEKDASEYGITFGEGSRSAFWNFALNVHTRDEASLTLPDNGLLNALWGSRKGTYVWAEFHDDNRVWVMENTSGEARKGVYPTAALTGFVRAYEGNLP